MSCPTQTEALRASSPRALATVIGRRGTRGSAAEHPPPRLRRIVFGVRRNERAAVMNAPALLSMCRGGMAGISLADVCFVVLMARAQREVCGATSRRTLMPPFGEGRLTPCN